MSGRMLTTAGCLFLMALAGCSGRDERAARRHADDQAPKVEAVKPAKVTDADPLVLRGDYTATVEPWQKTDLCAQVRGVTLNELVNALLKKDIELIEAAE